MEWIVHRTADYYVVEQVDAVDFWCLSELARELDVGRTWAGVATGMIVRNDDRGSRRENRDLEHLSRMREGARERSQCDHRPTDGFVFRSRQTTHRLSWQGFLA